MREHGFITDEKNPINVIRTPVSLTTIDNTRVAIAQELGISEISVVVHNYDDPLPEIMIKARRFGTSKTWGEALDYRTGNQRPTGLPRYGTPERPHLPSSKD